MRPQIVSGRGSCSLATTTPSGRLVSIVRRSVVTLQNGAIRMFYGHFRPIEASDSVMHCREAVCVPTRPGTAANVLAFLGRLHAPELREKQQVVDDFQNSRR